MISSAIAAVASLLGAGSLVGLVIKLGTGLGWTWIGSAVAVPIIGTVARAAEKLFDLVLWLARGALGILGRGADHVSKSVPAAVLFVTVVTIAWKFGPGDWRFWDPVAPPARVSTAPASSPTWRSNLRRWLANRIAPAEPPMPTPTQLPDLFNQAPEPAPAKSAKRPTRRQENEQTSGPFDWIERNFRF